MSGRAPGSSRVERVIALLFLLSAIAGVALLGIYLAGGQTQVEAVLLATSLGGIGIGIIVWSQWLLPNTLRVEDRHPVADSADPEAEREILDEEAAITRRSLLVRALAVSLAGLAAALAIPVLSLGPAPGRALFETPWRRGLRLVGLDGQPIRAADLPVDGVVTAFPEGFVGSSDAQTLLIRVNPTCSSCRRTAWPGRRTATSPTPSCAPMPAVPSASIVPPSIG